ncbi:DUF975 family protein [Streptococcus suis]|nr:DUF975 family protein [Streptococcus suis]
MIRNVKQKAKATLSNLPGKYALFALPILLTFVNVSISFKENISQGDYSNTSFATAFFPLLISFLLSFFTISALYAMLEVIRGERHRVAFSDITYSFSGNLFGKLFVTLLVRGLLTTLFSIPLFIGLAVLLIGLVLPVLQKQATNMSILLIILGIVFFILGLMLSIYKNCQYSQAEFLVYDQAKAGEYQGALATIKESKRLMKGHVWEAILLYLSFIGWYLLLLLTFGLVNIYLLPYLNTTRATYYQYLLEQADKETPSIIDTPLSA